MKYVNNKRKYILYTIWILSILIVFSLISIMYVQNISNDLKNDSRQSIANHMEKSKEIIDAEFRNDKAIVEFFAVTLAENPISDFSELRDLFYRYMTDVDKSNFARISIILPDGTEYYIDGEVSEVKNRENFERNMRNQFTISAPYKDEYVDQKVIEFNAPISVSGEVLGVVSAKKKTIMFEKRLASKFYYGYGFGMIISNNGDIIMTSLYQGKGNEFSTLNGKVDDNNSDTPFIDNLKLGNQGIVTYSIDNENFIAGYMPLEYNSEWNLLYMVPEKVVNQRLESVLTNTLFACVVVFILIFALACHLLLTRRNSYNEISKLAYVDSITGLPNITKFVKETNKLFSKNRKEDYVILQFDVDKFKYVNELFGYDVGNELLKIIADALKKHKRSGEIFARNNSDNFVIIMKYIDDMDVLNKIDSITEYIRKNAHSLIGRYDLHLPWGVYKICKEDPDDIYELLDRTVIAKNSIKHSYHKSYAIFSEEMRNRELKEKEIENMMESALTNDEFKIYIQPKFDLKTSKLAGGEALIRWQRGSSMISPNEFIPIFEKNGFVIRLDYYVLDKICKKMQEWVKNNMTMVPISINQSRLHLREPNYIEKLTKAVEKYDVPKKYVEFELTEGAVCESPDEIKKVIDELNAQGFLTSIDDFGSGYSSLNMLGELSVDVIKMDKGFLAATSNAKNSRIVVEQVLSLARNLDIKVVAEGVETEEQATFLRDNGCDIVQGFLYARPMPIYEFEELLYNNSVNAS